MTMREVLTYVLLLSLLWSTNLTLPTAQHSVIVNGRGGGAGGMQRSAPRAPQGFSILNPPALAGLAIAAVKIIATIAVFTWFSCCGRNCPDAAKLSTFVLHARGRKNWEYNPSRLKLSRI